MTMMSDFPPIMPELWQGLTAGEREALAGELAGEAMLADRAVAKLLARAEIAAAVAEDLMMMDLLDVERDVRLASALAAINGDDGR